MLSRPYLLESLAGGNGADATGVMSALLFFGYIGTMIWVMVPLVSTVPCTTLGMFCQSKKLLHPHLTSTPAPSMGGMSSVFATLTPAPGARFTRTPISTRRAPTPYPTYTLYPTYTPLVFGEVSTGLFSFYDPLIGLDKPEIAETNCEKWNYVTNDCDSKMRDGQDFRDYYGKAAACDHSLYIQRARFRVVSPAWLVRIFPDGFTCLDTGGLVALPYFDFLIRWKDLPFDWSRIPWRAPVVLERLN